MFTPGQRQRLRDELIAVAHTDPRITGAAITGSVAAGREDRWSDIDLALCIAEDPEPVIDDWTGRMYAEHSAVRHLDVYRGATLYRVFLLDSTLQVDVAFFAAGDFGATAPTFRLLFGTANDLPHPPPPEPLDLANWAWLYALHARSSIERGRGWQAEYMISGMRDSVLAMACRRHGVPAVEGRGLHELPAELTAGFAATLVTSLDDAGLRSAFAATTTALLDELAHVDPELTARLRGPLEAMAGR